MMAVSHTAAGHTRTILHIPVFVLLMLFLASLVVVMPLALVPFGGDIMFQYVALDCFASQFWGGQLYPRWCFEANAGLGAPLFVFYFPLPFYLASLLYPLTWLGVPIETVYLLLLWLATLVTGITAWVWLRDLATPEKALLLAVICLLLPYRMDVMMFRSAYAELWCLAWAPLACKYARRLAQGQRQAMAGLAAALALCFLSNMPAAVIIALASGGYLLLMVDRRSLGIMARYALALGWAAALSAFYLGPAILYRPFITAEGVIAGERSWCNDFLTLANVTEHGQGHLAVTIALMLAATLGLMAYAGWRRARVEDAFTRREMRAWALLAALAAFMLFPASKPVWDHMGFVAMLAFPWRMQLVIMLAAVFFMAVAAQWMMPPELKAVRKGDIAMGLAMLLLLAGFVISARPPDFVTYGDRIMASRFVTQREYRTIWTDRGYIAMPYILQRHSDRDAIAKVQVTEGEAAIAVRQWDKAGILLDVDAARPSVARVDVYYFPLWRAEATGAQTVGLKPEEGSGRMLLSLPAGRYPLRLQTSIYMVSFWKVAASMLASALAFALLCYHWRRQYCQTTGQ